MSTVRDDVHTHEHAHVHDHEGDHHGPGHTHGEPPGAVGATAVRIQHLHFRYPDGFEALKGLDLAIAPGEKIALVGPNGAGKSTLLLHFNGIHEPTHGTVHVGETLVDRS